MNNDYKSGDVVTYVKDGIHCFYTHPNCTFRDMILTDFKSEHHVLLILNVNNSTYTVLTCEGKIQWTRVHTLELGYKKYEHLSV